EASKRLSLFRNAVRHIGDYSSNDHFLVFYPIKFQQRFFLYDGLFHFVDQLQIAHRVGTEMFDFELIVIQGMARQINTDDILFVLQFFDQAPLRTRCQQWFWQRDACSAAKKAYLCGLFVFLETLPKLDCLFNTGQTISISEEILSAMGVLEPVKSAGVG